MESLLANFDIDDIKNFWKVYPSWKSPKIFNDFYKADKTKHKSRSSLIMWGIVHMFEKSAENPWRNMDSQDRIELINSDILEEDDFNWEKHKDLVDYAQKIIMTEEERNLYVLEQYIENRRKFLDDMQGSINFETMKELDASIKRNADIAKELDRLRNAVELAGEEGVTKGGKIESAGEKGEI